MMKTLSWVLDFIWGSKVVVLQGEVCMLERMKMNRVKIGGVIDLR